MSTEPTKEKMTMTALSAEEGQIFCVPVVRASDSQLATSKGYRIWKPRSDRNSQYMPYSLIDLQTRAIVQSGQLRDIEDRLRDEDGDDHD
jgi:hypothetical protein